MHKNNEYYSNESADRILLKTFCIAQSFPALIKGKSTLLIFGILMVVK